MSEDRLNSLLLVWQEQRDRGRDPDAAELCRDCPQLADELRRQIAVLRQVAALVPSGGAAGGPSEPHAGPGPGADSCQTALVGDGCTRILGSPRGTPLPA